MLGLLSTPQTLSMSLPAMNLMLLIVIIMVFSTLSSLSICLPTFKPPAAVVVVHLGVVAIHFDSAAALVVAHL